MSCFNTKQTPLIEWDDHRMVKGLSVRKRALKLLKPSNQLFPEIQTAVKSESKNNQELLLLYVTLSKPQLYLLT